MEIIGRVGIKKQEDQSRQNIVRDPLGVKGLISGATALQTQRDIEKDPMSHILTPKQTAVVSKVASSLPISPYKQSLITRAAPYVKASYLAYQDYSKKQQAKPMEQKLEEFGPAVGRIGMSLVKGFNEGVVRFVKSGSEALIGKEKTKKIAEIPIINKFGQSLTGRQAEEKIATFQEIGDKVFQDAITHGATIDEAHSVTSIAVLGSMLADAPFLPEKGLGKNAIKIIAESTNASTIEKVLIKEVPDLVNKATPEQIKVISEMLTNVKRETDVETILNRTKFASQGRVTAAKAEEATQKMIEPPKKVEVPTTIEKPVVTEAKPVKTPKAPKKEITPEIKPLMEEAKKYKSAEEFTKAQGKLLYHATPSENIVKIEKTGLTPSDRGALGPGYYFTPDKKASAAYVKEMKGKESSFVEVAISNDAKIYNYKPTKPRFEQDDLGKAIRDARPEEIRKLVTDAGYDGVAMESGRIGGADSYVIYNKDVFKTKSQLTDIYNRAQAQSSEITTTPPSPTGPITKKAPPGFGKKPMEGKGSAKAAQPRPNVKLQKMASEASSFDEFYKKSGVTLDSLNATARSKGYVDASDFYEKHKSDLDETDYYTALSEQQKNTEYALRASKRDDEIITSNLEKVFADLKGVEIKDLKTKFTENDLEQAKLQYEFAMEALLDDPARALVKYISKSTGNLPEVTGTEFITSPKGTGKIKNSEFGKRGDRIIQEIFGYDKQFTREDAQIKVDEYLQRREAVKDYLQKVKNISNSIRLSKQKDTFVGKEKAKLAREVATNQKALQNIVEAAERAGFKRGMKHGAGKYEMLINNLRERRNRLNAVKARFNLTDSQMKLIRRQPYTDKNDVTRYKDPDPRFMTAAEFNEYMVEVAKEAKIQHQKNTERIIIDALIKEKDLKKTENLQRALEFPPIKDMSVEQLREFGDILSRTEVDDMFLGPRMIQTAKNTDLGNIRTVGEAIKKMAQQTGMPFKPVEGKRRYAYMRDPALVDSNPIFNMIIREWIAREAKILNEAYALERESSKLARASRVSRRKLNAELRKKGTLKQTYKDRMFDYLAPKDSYPVAFAQTSPQNLFKLKQEMTPEEIAFGELLRKFFGKIHKEVTEDAANRWTLRGVKYSRFKDMYFPHMKRQFMERWRDDGFTHALKVLWQKESTETKIDWTAFGDRGEILGYEKFFKYNMKREGAAAFSENAVRTLMSYHHAFARKMLADEMIPKGKLYEFLYGARFKTPASINNPDGAKAVHALLSRNLNEWFNNKKGQRVAWGIEQGDRIEAVVETASAVVTILDLGANLSTQLGSSVGGFLFSAKGLGLKKYMTQGLRRSMTKQGSKIAKENAGILGTPPWWELAKASNDLGDTLRSGMFYIFGDLSYRARRQQFLGLLTKEEFKTGIISDKRLSDIKIEIGKYHHMSEFDSVVGSTALPKAASKYMSWATPMFQQSMQDVTKLYNELRMLSGKPEDFKKFVKSEGFRNTFHTLIWGIGAYVIGNMVFQPDKDDKTFAGRLRFVAARDMASILQAATGQVFMGGKDSGPRMLGFFKDVYNIGQLLLTLEQYDTYGKGYRPGDIKAFNEIQRVFTPALLKQFLPQKEQQYKTKEDIRNELKQKLESGELTTDSAKVWLAKELKSLKTAEENRRMDMTTDEYRADLKQRLANNEITMEDAKVELAKYLKQQKQYAPESFESKSDADFIGKIIISAKALRTDPVTLFEAIFTKEKIRRMDNGEIILYRGKETDPQKQKEFALKERKERGASTTLRLDHTIPLQLGGDNSKGNLKLVSTEEWENYTPVENYLGQALRAGDVSGKEAQKLIRKFKIGEMTAQEVYDSLK